MLNKESILGINKLPNEWKLTLTCEEKLIDSYDGGWESYRHTYARGYSTHYSIGSISGTLFGYNVTNAYMIYSKTYYTSGYDASYIVLENNAQPWNIFYMLYEAYYDYIASWSKANTPIGAGYEYKSPDLSLQPAAFNSSGTHEYTFYLKHP